MIWLLIVLAALVGVVLIFVAGLYACDPEGRGAGRAIGYGLAGVVLFLAALGTALWRLLR